MSTRCVTLVREVRRNWRTGESGPEEIMRFYRHCDGYPSGHGVDIAEAILETGDHKRYCTSWSQNVIGNLLLKDACMEIEPKETVHGDLEYLYVIEADEDTGFRRYGKDIDSIADDVTISVFGTGWDVPYEEATAKEPLFSGTASEYLKWVYEAHE